MDKERKYTEFHKLQFLYCIYFHTQYKTDKYIVSDIHLCCVAFVVASFSLLNFVLFLFSFGMQSVGTRFGHTKPINISTMAKWSDSTGVHRCKLVLEISQQSLLFMLNGRNCAKCDIKFKYIFLLDSFIAYKFNQIFWLYAKRNEFQKSLMICMNYP